jgi:hypothetical protein
VVPMDSITMFSQRDVPDFNSSGNRAGIDLEPVNLELPRIALVPEYEVDVVRRLVSVKFRGEVTIREIEKYAASLRTDPLFQPDFSEIVDMSDVVELHLSAEELMHLANEVDPFSAKAKRAFVVRDEVQSHAARMHKILRTQPNISVFRSVGEARRWILTQV